MRYRQRKTSYNRRLAQWRVTWLIEHSTSHQLLWCIDSLVLRNPPLRQAPNRYVQFPPTLKYDAIIFFSDSKLRAKCVKRNKISRGKTFAQVVSISSWKVHFPKTDILKTTWRRYRIFLTFASALYLAD